MPRMMSESPRARKQRLARAACLYEAALILRARHEDDDLVNALNRIATVIANEGPDE